MEKEATRKPQPDQTLYTHVSIQFSNSNSFLPSQFSFGSTIPYYQISIMKRYLFRSSSAQSLQEQPHRPSPELVVQDSAMTTTSHAEPNIREQKPLSPVVEAFEDLANHLQRIDIDGGELRLDTFCDSCSLVSILFSCLGLAFKFAESEYVSKVGSLLEASKRHKTLQNILDLDVANGTVRTAGSHSRNLRRVRQGLDLIRALFEQFLATDDYSLKDAATTAYAQTCAPYHTWAIRTAVYAGMYALPSRDQLLLNLCETDQSAEKKMRRYINASLPVIRYIDKLYVSRNISLDW